MDAECKCIKWIFNAIATLTEKVKYWKQPKCPSLEDGLSTC